MNGNRINFLDTLKGLAIIGVVIIHVNAQLIDDVTLYGVDYVQGSIDNLILFFLSFLSRFCVPVFILVTAYLHWRPTADTGIIKVLKRLVPVILIYLLWSMIYTLPQHTGQEDFYSLFVLGKSAPPMYYIPLIYIPVVLFMAVLRRIKHSPYTLLGALLVTTSLQYSEVLGDGDFSNLGFTLSYAVVGAGLTYVSNNKKILLYASIALGSYLLVHILFILNSPDVIGSFKHNFTYYNFFVFALSLFVFIAAMIVPYQSKWLSMLGHHSMTIYLQHWLFYVFFYGLWKSLFMESNVVVFCGGLILLYAVITALPVIVNRYTTRTIPARGIEHELLAVNTKETPLTHNKGVSRGK